MKRSILLLVITSQLANAQGFSDKTNAIRINLNTTSVASVLPVIEWTVPKNEKSNSVEESVAIEANISSVVALKSVRFEINSGGESFTKDVAVKENEFTKAINQTLRLLPGENIVKIVVENIQGGSVSSLRSILTGRDAVVDAVNINRKDYALIIATDNYDNFNDLTNPINDAKTIESILREKYGFITEVVENPSQQEINDKLYEYNTRKFDTQDQLLVFVAGHGIFDETLGQGYLVASNSLFNDRGKSSYIPHVVLRETLDRMKCEHIMLVMDVCFGGTFDPLLARSRSDEAMDEAADQQYLVKKLTKRTRKFLTSGSKEYVSDGLPGKHSPFAEKFLLALKETGGGTGRLLTINELQTYFLRLASEPRFGPFGTDDPASDFVFVAR